MGLIRIKPNKNIEMVSFRWKDLVGKGNNSSASHGRVSTHNFSRAGVTSWPTNSVVDPTSVCRLFWLGIEFRSLVWVRILQILEI